MEKANLEIEREITLNPDKKTEYDIENLSETSGPVIEMVVNLLKLKVPLKVFNVNILLFRTWLFMRMLLHTTWKNLIQKKRCLQRRVKICLGSQN